MVGSIRHWPPLFKQAYDNLAPGGWIEIADPYLITSDDNTLPEDSPFRKWNRILIEASERNATSMMATANYKKWLIEQGLWMPCRSSTRGRLIIGRRIRSKSIGKC